MILTLHLTFGASHHISLLYDSQGRLRWVTGRIAAPFALIHGGAGGARIALHTEFFPSLLSSEWALSRIVDRLVEEAFSWGKPPDPQICIVVLGNQYASHCSSGKDFEDRNLSLWRNIYMYIDVPSGEALLPLP